VEEALARLDGELVVDTDTMRAVLDDAPLAAALAVLRRLSPDVVDVAMQTVPVHRAYGPLFKMLRDGSSDAHLRDALKRRTAAWIASHQLGINDLDASFVTYERLPGTYDIAGENPMSRLYRAVHSEVDSVVARHRVPGRIDFECPMCLADTKDTPPGNAHPDAVVWPCGHAMCAHCATVYLTGSCICATDRSRICPEQRPATGENDPRIKPSDAIDVARLTPRQRATARPPIPAANAAPDANHMA
jgi:hypothetical protein